MQTFDRLSRKVDPDNLCWSRYTGRVLDKYRNLPRY